MSDTNGYSLIVVDPWVSDEVAATPLAMTKRDTSLRTIASLAAAVSLLRTETFSAGDSTWLGVSVRATFDGDSAGQSGSHVTYRVELIDSATGQRTALLDSFRISPVSPSHSVNLTDTLDLLSGRYYLRVLVDTIGVTVPGIAYDSRFPIGELQIEMGDSLPPFKLARLAGHAHKELRVTTHPNPASSTTETRFTVPTSSRVRITITDMEGRHATTLLEEWLEAGRYALDIDLRNLIAGLYIVRIEAGDDSGVAKIVVDP